MRCGIGAYEKVWGLLGGAQRAGALGMQGPGIFVPAALGAGVQSSWAKCRVTH